MTLSTPPPPPFRSRFSSSNSPSSSPDRPSQHHASPSPTLPLAFLLRSPRRTHSLSLLLCLSLFLFLFLSLSLAAVAVAADLNDTAADNTDASTTTSPTPLPTPVRTVAGLFEDVSEAAGLQRPYGRRKKYGGPALADLDGDGRLDFLLGHHGGRDCLNIYFNARNAVSPSSPSSGTLALTKSAYSLWRDLHGVSPLRLAPGDRDLHVLLSGGGSNGKRPRSPHILAVRLQRRARVVTEVTGDSPDFAGTHVRGRSALPLSMRVDPRNRTRPDVLLLNRQGFGVRSDHRAFAVTPARTLAARALHPRALRDARATDFAGALDIDGDGTMEVLVLGTIRLWRLVADYSYDDVTAAVLPSAPVPPMETSAARRRRLRRAGVPLTAPATAPANATDPAAAAPNAQLDYAHFLGCRAFVAFDYNNDGHVDVFVTRGLLGRFYPASRRPSRADLLQTDVLLRNAPAPAPSGGAGASGIGGRVLVDATQETGVSGLLGAFASASHGVTAADFDNDGWEDVLIARYAADPPYVLLRNVGGRTFERVDPALLGDAFRRPANIPGDGLVAADVDNDGRVDVVVSEGHWDVVSQGGYYRILKNNWHSANAYLRVRVRDAPGLTTTSLHARVTVTHYDGRTITRTVGSPGVQTSVSLLDTVHFGLGNATRVRFVRVRWADGTEQTRRGVRANRTIQMGAR